jgi:hypothetical protein
VRALVHTEGENQNDDLKDDEDNFLVHDSSSLLECGMNLVATKTALVCN